MTPHHLKNAKYRLFKDSTLLPKEFYSLITGNPLQNSTEELWAPLKIFNSDMFESKEDLVGKLSTYQYKADK